VPGSSGWPPIRLVPLGVALSMEGATLIAPGTQGMFLEELAYFNLLEPANDETF
jgi:hypothetical protein